MKKQQKDVTGGIKQNPAIQKNTNSLSTNNRMKKQQPDKKYVEQSSLMDAESGSNGSQNIKTVLQNAEYELASLAIEKCKEFAEKKIDQLPAWLNLCWNKSIRRLRNRHSKDKTGIVIVDRNELERAYCKFLSARDDDAAEEAFIQSFIQHMIKVKYTYQLQNLFKDHFSVKEIDRKKWFSENCPPEILADFNLILQITPEKVVNESRWEELTVFIEDPEQNIGDFFQSHDTYNKLPGKNVFLEKSLTYENGKGCWWVEYYLEGNQIIKYQCFSRKSSWENPDSMKVTREIECHWDRDDVNMSSWLKRRVACL